MRPPAPANGAVGVTKDEQIKLLMDEMMHQVGDTRRCPHCGHSFVPNDRTSEDAWAAFQKVDRDRHDNT